MAKNDTILIDGILDDRVAQQLPSDRRDEAFEYFAFEQILRDADLSQDELLAGSIDGRGDGGIDGFYIIVNGHPLIDPESFLWPRSGCELDVWIITCKHHDTFRQAPLDNLVASLTELLNLSLADDSLKGSYSEALLRARAHLIVAYRKVSPRLNRFTIHFVYASRGDAANVGSAIEARASQAVTIAKDMFGNCDASFAFVGAAELVTIQRKVRTFSLDLPFLEALTRGERYVLLCRLSDFYAFVVDDSQKLRRYLFDSNVRAFMGLNRVNEDIRDTLNDSESPDFWWLNNGITILANSAVVTGKSIQIEGVQIVNGLQTTESITRYFGDGRFDEKERSVLVKIIVSTDPTVRDAIIRATNNQTAVELTSLHATDKIQRDIEDVMLRAGLFYERRTRFYVNQGHPTKSIVSPLYVAAGYMNLVLKSPSTAMSLRSKFMRSSESYARVFSSEAPLKVWPVIARILKKTDALLERERPTGTGANERFLKNWRQITSMLAVARAIGNFSFGAHALSEFSPEHITDDLLYWAWELVKASAALRSGLKHRKGIDFAIEVCRKAATDYSISDVECIEHRRVISKTSTGEFLESKFVDQVDALLPNQPWKPGIHYRVAQQLRCPVKPVSVAIQYLIEKGRRYKQRDGVVYAVDGSIIATDPERVQFSEREL